MLWQFDPTRLFYRTQLSTRDFIDFYSFINASYFIIIVLSSNKSRVNCLYFIDTFMF